MEDLGNPDKGWRLFSACGFGNKPVPTNWKDICKDWGKPMTTKRELQEQVEILEAESQEQVKILRAKIDAMPDDKGGRWKPEADERYFYAGSFGDIQSTLWDGSGNAFHRELLVVGNCFKTKELAKRHVENLKVHYELMDLADYEPDWGDGQQNWHIRYCHKSSNIRFVWSYCEQSARTIYFRNERESRRIAKKVGEKRVIAYLQGV